jgi:hypothetical protein
MPKPEYTAPTEIEHLEPLYGLCLSVQNCNAHTQSECHWDLAIDWANGGGGRRCTGRLDRLGVSGKRRGKCQWRTGRSR